MVEKTLLVPLPGSTLPPACHSASCVVPSCQVIQHLAEIYKTIKNTEKVVVICGAGISTAAGIPDFRSKKGLFNSVQKSHCRTRIKDGKTLFDVSVLQSHDMSVSFCKMIGELAQQSELASPTTFHRLMQYLDSTGQLFRVFTQNIDCLEAKCGISFGLPSLGLDVNTGPRQVRVRKRQASTWDLPRCIPLHGRIDSVHCVLCHQSYAIGHYINTFLSGVFPVCDLCQDVKTLRPFTNKRSRGVGNLRPSIVLYNETHSSADVIGEAIARDLKEVCAHDVDVVLLVVGTSLQIPSVKTMVRQFARKLHTHKDRSAMRSIYLNMEFPAASSEWGGVFDAWIYGDVQEFACAILTSMGKV